MSSLFFRPFVLGAELRRTVKDTLTWESSDFDLNFTPLPADQEIEVASAQAGAGGMAAGFVDELSE